MHEKWLNIIIALGVLVLAHLLVWISRRLLGRFFKGAAEVLQLDATRFNFLKNAVTFVIYSAATIIVFNIIPELRSVGVTLFAGAGIIAAIVGFASQQAFSNIISGIFIVIFKPFRVGDFIKIGTEHFGTVEDITLRHVVINNPENRRIVIPNSIISSQTIINSTITETEVCNLIEINVGFDTNLDQAISLIREVTEAHPDLIDRRSQEDLEAEVPLVVIRTLNIGEYAITLRAYAWAESGAKAFAMKSDLLKAIKEKFDEVGIKLPYPHRRILMEASEK